MGLKWVKEWHNVNLISTITLGAGALNQLTHLSRMEFPTLMN